jgi:ribosomal protein S1
MPQHEISAAAWKKFLAGNSEGDVLDATVVKVVPFGAFLEVAPGIHGLLHKSEWSAEPAAGATMPVRIVAVDLENRRMSLRPA